MLSSPQISISRSVSSFDHVAISSSRNEFELCSEQDPRAHTITEKRTAHAQYGSSVHTSIPCCAVPCRTVRHGCLKRAGTVRNGTL